VEAQSFADVGQMQTEKLQQAALRKLNIAELVMQGNT